MAARERPDGPLNTRNWHLILVKKAITRAGTVEPIDLTQNHRWWLASDEAEGEYRVYNAPEFGKIVYFFSDLNTAMHFRLKFG